MEEIRNRILRYKDLNFDQETSTFKGLTALSATFYSDVAEIYDTITRVRNVERNPTGFSLTDAPILGLLVRIWKILKEIVVYYKANNADILGLLDRQLIESAVVAQFLQTQDDLVLEDYRKCSYKDRLRILQDASTNAAFFATPPGKRLLASVKAKMQHEGLTPQSFELQKKRRWKLQGKSFFDIFSEVQPSDFYKFMYGIPSESIHGSWNDSMDYHLRRNEDGTFSTYPHYQEADVRFISPLLPLCNAPYRLWLKRIGVDDSYLIKTLDWIQQMNGRLFSRFEPVFSERNTQGNAGPLV
jgi:hypothetical protein